MARLLVVQGHGVSLRVKRRAVVVAGPGGESTVVPLAEVDRVVIATSGVSITSSAVRVLARNGIGIVFLDGRGSPIVSLEPPWVNATAETRIQQYRAYMERRLDYAKSFVAAKMENQARLLEHLHMATGEEFLAGEAGEIRRLQARARAARDLGELREAEAGAARRYWGSLARLLPGELGFRGRDPSSGDPVNMVLNYAYSLLYAEVFQALVVHGLDPYIGFMHVVRSGSPSLVFDYSEMFRVSAVDYLVYRLLAVEGWRPRIDTGTGLLDRETRLRLIEEEAKWMRRRTIDYRGQPEPLSRHISLYARRLAQSIRSNSPYNGFVEDYRP